MESKSTIVFDLFLQVHYKNPLSEKDYAGVNLRYTTEQPKYFGGIYLMLNPDAILPPHQPRIDVDVNCKVNAIALKCPKYQSIQSILYFRPMFICYSFTFICTTCEDARNIINRHREIAISNYLVFANEYLRLHKISLILISGWVLKRLQDFSP